MTNDKEIVTTAKNKAIKRRSPMSTPSSIVTPSAKKAKVSSNGKAITTKQSPSLNGVKTPKKKSQVSTPVSKAKKEKSINSKISTLASKVKKERSTSKSGTPLEDEEEADDTYRWWEMENHDNTIKWTTLEHNGVMFPPEYKPLPKRIKLYYDGQPVDLPPEAEEVAGFFAAMLQTDHAKNPVFQKNFFHDFLQVLKEVGGCNVQIKEFEKCDFTKMFHYFDKEREKKKSIPSSEKKKAKLERDELEAPFKICKMDGRTELVGNFRIEPPGLFRGRGAHPKAGKLKRRVVAEQVTLNIGKEAKVPKPPKGRQWGEIKHDNTVTWLATWKENINNSPKYVLLSQSSSLKGMSDYKKFERARELKKHINTIRKDYRRELKDELMINRQRATATYLIDVFALRAGGEKGDDEADTVGCCSLRYEHITLTPPRTVIFDFLGKDSIRYHQEVEVDAQVYKNLKIFKKPPKREGDDIFDRLDPSILNKHLQNYMDGLTAKVFRTYNASKTMQDELDKIPIEGTIQQRLLRFNAANRAVAILCNHQRTVGKGHEASVAKTNDKIREMEWNKIRLLKMMLVLDSKLKKKKPELFEEIDTLLTQEEVTKVIEIVLEKEHEKIIKKFDKDNEKLVAEGQKKMLKPELNDRLKAIKELEKQYKKEQKTGKVEVKANSTIEKLQAQVEKLQERINNTKLQLKDKEANSSVALGTSKMNYIDPRLTVMFSKKYGVPLEKLFTKTLRDKFKWAIESADEDWKF